MPRGQRPVAPGREVQEATPAMWDQARAELETYVEKMRTVPVEDRAAWGVIAKQTAGAFAAWSQAVEPTPGPLAEAARVISRSSQTYREPTRSQRVDVRSLTDTAVLFAVAARGGEGMAAQAAMLRQLVLLQKSIRRASLAAGDARHARIELAHVRDRLREVHDRLPQPVAAAPGEAEVAGLDEATRRVMGRVRLSNERQAAEAVLSPAPNPDAGPAQRIEPSVPERGRSR